ncbi:MAG: molybdopterin-binding protein [Pirellulales bacterium]|nr:molybdopterin-binding protein [Pirellulales bacterium]
MKDNNEPHSIKAEVIAIGDELVSGVRLDTNSQWISNALLNRGIHVAWHTCVGDQLDDLLGVLHAAANRADLVVTTGGLGPTADDLTRDALAAVANVPLILDEASLAHITALFAGRKRSMPERNRQQAMLPRGATPIHNPHGTAPGIHLKLPRHTDTGTSARDDKRPIHLVCLPGVPAELREMWPNVIELMKPTLPENSLTVHHELHCFGAGESDIEAMLPDLIRRGRKPSVGITASKATVTLRVTASGADAEECRRRMQPTITQIRESLGNLIIGENGAQLPDTLLAVLARRDETLATVEMGSAGQLALWLNLAAQETGDESSLISNKNIFCGGVVQPPVGNGSFDELLVKLACETLLERDVDWVLGVGPFPNNTSDDQSNLSFAVVIATNLALHHKQTGQMNGVNYRIREYPFASHPAIAAERAAKIALNALRKEILRHDIPASRPS